MDENLAQPQPQPESQTQPQPEPQPGPQPEPQPGPQSQPPRPPRPNIGLLVMVLIIALAAAAVIGLLTLHRTPKSPVSSPAAGTSSSSTGAGTGNGPGTLSLSPADGSFAPGSTINVTIHENSGTSAVNAVQANVTYPTDKLQFVSVNGSNSAFSVAAQGAASFERSKRFTIDNMVESTLAAYYGESPAPTYLRSA